MWGQVIQRKRAVTDAGIIPTRVGTSGAGDVDYGAERDHPHACGDKSSTTGSRSAKLGSSPRVWGQADFTFLCVLDVRIIPTRVGTSIVDFLLFAVDRDHPHACGDKVS